MPLSFIVLNKGVSVDASFAHFATLKCQAEVSQSENGDLGGENLQLNKT